MASHSRLSGSVFPFAAVLLLVSPFSCSAASSLPTTGTTLRVRAAPAPVAGEQAQAWARFDDSVLSGPFTLSFKLETHDGRPAAGKKWTLAAGGLMPDDPPRRVVAEGIVPPSGLVEVTGLGGIEKAVNAEELKKQRRFAPWYTLLSGRHSLGQASFFEWGKMTPEGKVTEFLPPADQRKVQEREFTLPPDIGEPAPDVTLFDLATSRPMRLSELRGQIVLLEFWSSRCHSCEPIMAKNEELAARRGKDWLGKALILAASIDSEAATASRFVKEKGWGAVRHTWSGEGGTGRYSEAAKAYVITGTPAAVLIGKDGKILWSGSPWELNIEASFDTLIRQQNTQASAQP